MSSAVVSSYNNPNFNINTTSVVTQDVLNCLNPSNFQNVEFNSIVNPLPPIYWSNTSSTGPVNEVLTGTNLVYTLTAEDLVQSACASGRVVMEPPSAGTATTLAISLGSDTAANGAALATLFNLSSNNQFVITNYYQFINQTSTTATGPSGAASSPTGVFLQVNAPSNSGTGLYVNLPYSNTTAVSGTASVTLFNNTVSTIPKLQPVRFEYVSLDQVVARVLPLGPAQI